MYYFGALKHGNSVFVLTGCSGAFPAALITRIAEENVKFGGVIAHSGRVLGQISLLSEIVFAINIVNFRALRAIV